MNEKEIKSLKEHVKTTGHNIFATFKVEIISNLIIYYENLQKQNAELKEENENLRKKNRVYKATIKGQIKKIEELRIGKQTSKKIHKEKNKKIEEENILLHNRIDKVIEFNNKFIDDIKSFSIPTTEPVYSGDCLIDILEKNIEKLKGSDKK